MSSTDPHPQGYRRRLWCWCGCRFSYGHFTGWRKVNIFNPSPSYMVDICPPLTLTPKGTGGGYGVGVDVY